MEHDQFEPITILGFQDTNAESDDGDNLYPSNLQMVYSPTGIIKEGLSNLNQNGTNKESPMKEIASTTTKYRSHRYCARILSNET